MTLKNLTTILAILAAMLFVGCGGEEEAESTEATTTETEPAAEPEAEEPAAEPAAEAAPAAGGGSACDRAQRCCEAYIGAMNSAMPAGAPQMTAEQTCAGVAGARAAGAAGDTSCNTMITGWRTSLEQQQRAVPGDCSAQ